jgi:hypothetical protein
MIRIISTGWCANAFAEAQHAAGTRCERNARRTPESHVSEVIR